MPGVLDRPYPRPYGAARLWLHCGNRGHGGCGIAGDSMGSEPQDDFDARLRAAQEREASERGADKPGAGGTTSGIGLGLRIGVELVAGVVVGALIGVGLDRWLGTKPWLMIVFFFLGAAAGILNAYRASQGMDDTIGFGAASRRKSKGK